MNEEIETTTLLGSQIKDALSAVPEEVQSFMWSDEYKIIIDTIQKTLSLDDKEKDLLKYGSYELLLGIKTMEDLAKEWINYGMKPDLVIKVLYVIHEEILTRAQNITEFYTKDPNNPSEYDLEDEGNTESGDRPAQVSDVSVSKQTKLTSLADRLKQTSIAAPTKRDYTIDISKSAVASEAGDTKPSIDPYHEPIDNE